MKHTAFVTQSGHFLSLAIKTDLALVGIKVYEEVDICEVCKSSGVS
jgi:hypothetical protein